MIKLIPNTIARRFSAPNICAAFMFGFMACVLSVPATAANLTLVDVSGTNADKQNCNYEQIDVDGKNNGVATIRLSNFTCLEAPTSGDCSLDGKTIIDGTSDTFWIADALPPGDCDTNSGERTCTSGDLDSINTQFVLSQCNITGEGACTDVDNNTILHNAERVFYKDSSVSCTSSDTKSRTCSDGVLSPADDLYVTINCDSTPSGGVVDTGEIGDNTTLGPMTDTATGLKVYILDRANGTTSVPSCVNGRSALSQCQANSEYTKGAKPDEVYAVRYLTTPNHTSAGYIIRPLEFGAGQVTPGAKFKYNISTTPGRMSGSEFSGRCTYEGNSTNLYVTSQAWIDKYPVLDGRCAVDENTLFYLNIQATSAICENQSSRCNDGVQPSAFAIPPY